MGAVREKERIADVICQHKRDGTIMPIKIRLQDDDGEFQSYQIKAYKDVSSMKREYIMPNGVTAQGHLWIFECKIVNFDSEKVIRLLYNAFDNVWKVLGEKY